MALTFAVPVVLPAVKMAVYEPSPLSVSEESVPSVAERAMDDAAPTTGFPLPSLRKTVTGDVPPTTVEPTTVTTVCPALTGPETKLTCAELVNAMPPMLPEIVAEPIVVGAVRCATYVPLALSTTIESVPLVAVSSNVPADCV